MNTETAETKFPEVLTDKNGTSIKEDDVIYNGTDYYRIYWNKRQPQVEAISCTNGYLHDISQEDLHDFERIGTFAQNEHLFQCD